MPTRRENILNDIKTRMATITGSPYVEINRVTPPDFNTDPFPLIFVYSSTQSRAVNTQDLNSKESWIWQVVIEAWAYDTNMEEFAGNIYAKWYEDLTLGGYAIDSKLVSFEIFDVEPSRRLFGVELTFEVYYRHEFGLPFS